MNKNVKVCGSGKRNKVENLPILFHQGDINEQMLCVLYIYK